MNEIMAVQRRAVFEIRQEYTIEYIEYILSTFMEAAGMTEADFVHGKVQFTRDYTGNGLTGFYLSSELYLGHTSMARVTWTI